jgi:cytochrome c biogenesis protein CcmG/thiol:disulfide interchange protein DsbE
MRRTIVSVVILLALLSITLYLNLYKTESNETNESNEIKAKKGNQAPNFTLESLEGESITLSELKGKPIFINFWASWCDPCKLEMPHIQAAYDQYGDQIQFIMINAIEVDSLEDVHAYMNEAGLDFPVYPDHKDVVHQKYHVEGWPTSFFIDRNGRIAEIVIGPMTKENLDSLINMILEE